MCVFCHFCVVSFFRLAGGVSGWGLCGTRELLLGLLLALPFSVAAAERLDSLSFVTSSGAPHARSLVQDWLVLLNETLGFAEEEKVKRVNAFFNQKIDFAEDNEVWGRSDYWATPLETLSQRRGDCEDFAIAKYFTLLKVGIPPSRLRLVYAKAFQDGKAGTISQAHMVLAYFSRPDRSPMILDNLSADVVPASARTDLMPIFSFNTDGLWVGTSNQVSGSSYSRWLNLVFRAHQEGF